jgi:DeoR/GlpR family transcriptional regulator of sugar metabolism
MKIHSDKLIALIKKERIVTSSEVAEKFSVSWNTAEKHLMELALDRRIERIKKVGVNLWMLR